METNKWQEVEKAYNELRKCSYKQKLPGGYGQFCPLPGGGIFYKKYEELIDALANYQESTGNSIDTIVFIGLRSHEAAEIKYMKAEKSEAARQAFVKRIREELDIIINSNNE